jgi:hypothetical protein
MEPKPDETVANSKTDAQHREVRASHDTGVSEKIEEIQVEVAAHQLNQIDFELLSRESIQFKSKATLRLILVIIIQGISTCLFYKPKTPLLTLLVFANAF